MSYQKNYPWVDLLNTWMHKRDYVCTSLVMPWFLPKEGEPLAEEREVGAI